MVVFKSALSVGSAAAAALFLAAGATVAETLSLDSDDSVKNTAGILARNLVSYYHGNETGKAPGVLPGPPPSGDYYWGNAATFWVSLLEYWHATGDASYNDIITKGLIFQSGDDSKISEDYGPEERIAYLPRNYTLSMGNDDQAAWALAALTAAEYNLPFPSSGTNFTSWAQLSVSVFNQQVERWKPNDTCGGGLRWQISPTNAGYDYKSTGANGYFLNLGARLAAYTSNDTYAIWAGKAWDWMFDVKLIDNSNYSVYDGIHALGGGGGGESGDSGECGNIAKTQFTDMHAAIAQGAAVMANYSDSDGKWANRLDKLLDHGLDLFFPDTIATDIACETPHTCTPDMDALKGMMLSRYAAIAQAVPRTKDRIVRALQGSASAAVKTCKEAATGYQCAHNWDVTLEKRGNGGSEYNAMTQSSAVNAVTAILRAKSKDLPATNKTAGSGSSDGKNGSEGGDKSTGSQSAAVKNHSVASVVTRMLLVLSLSALFTL